MKPLFISRITQAIANAVPPSLMALLARFSMAAVFWKSGQTKIEGFALDIVDRTAQLGWPHLNPGAVDLFRTEYKLPFLSPEVATTLAALGEHVLAALLLLGLATRFSALGLLVITLVIQVWVYPSAWPTHGTWAALLLYVLVYGPGKFSLDSVFHRSPSTRRGRA